MTWCGFAENSAWSELVLVGHSMVASLHCNWRQHIRRLSAAVCLIDSVVFPSDAFIAQLKLLGDQLAGAAYIQTLHLAAGALFIETDVLSGRHMC